MLLATNFVARLPLLEGILEAKFTRALVRQLLDLVKCKISNLLILASSEIIFKEIMLLTKKSNKGLFSNTLAIVFNRNK